MFLLKRSSFLALAVVASATAGAQVQYFTNYSVHNDMGGPITNIMMAEEVDNGGSLTWAFQADGEGDSLLQNPFPGSVPVQRALLIGLVQDLPEDPEGQKHIVLMMDNNAAALANHIAWGTLFPTTLEDQLIADLELATSGQDWEIIQPGLDAVSNFLGGEAKNILGPGGSSNSAWFNMGGSFSVMAFSEGQQIGSGQSFVTAVPEPASLGALCIGAAAFLRRRKAK